ncbi:MAG: hypothetical protein WBE58_06835 [Verrucomicrobiales bacterium]
MHAFFGPQGVEIQWNERSRGAPVHKSTPWLMPAVALFASFSDLETVTAPELVVGHDSRTILADKAYGRAAFRELLESVGLQACIPPPRPLKAARQSITEVFIQSAITLRISSSASKSPSLSPQGMKNLPPDSLTL